MRNLHLLNAHRITDPTFLEGCGGWPGDETCGAFLLRSPVDGATLRVIASSGEGWDHVSVSRGNRCPNWPEMEYVKRQFFRDDEYAIQLHVPPADHVNMHPYCLHLWRPLTGEIPRPPAILVGAGGEPADSMADAKARVRAALGGAADVPKRRRRRPPGQTIERQAPIQSAARHLRRRRTGRLAGHRQDLQPIDRAAAIQARRPGASIPRLRRPLTLHHHRGTTDFHRSHHPPFLLEWMCRRRRLPVGRPPIVG